MKSLGLGISLLLVAFLALGGNSCTSTISTLGPSNGGCSGSTSFANVTCPAAVLWANQGSVNLTGTLSVLDAYNSGAGAYGGANVANAGNVTAATTFVDTGAGSTVTGNVVQGFAANLLTVSPPVASQGVTVIATAGQTITLAAGNYYFSTIDWTGSGFQLHTTGGQVRIWFDTLNITGSGYGVGSGVPNDLWFLGTCGATANLAGSTGLFTGVIYNPTGTVNLTGAFSNYFGGIIGGLVNATGANSGYHRDQAICGY